MTLKIPITLLTGFLGSGKTTVLNSLLRHRELAQTLVIINEFGDIGLDHDLVESANDDIVLLKSGCVCCTMRSDLVDVLNTMFDKREHGSITVFDRVVVETTGVAEPGPIVQALVTDPCVSRRFCLDSILVTVDAAVGEGTFDRHVEAVRQAAVADRLLLTKTDLVEDAESLAIELRLRSLNPTAPIIRTLNGQIGPAQAFGIGLEQAARNGDVQNWFKIEADDSAHPSVQQENGHGEHIQAHCLVIEEPISARALERWLDSLFRLKGPDLLRFKAILNVAELPGPLVLHGVQHVIHPPLALQAWRSEDRRSRMVFITRNTDKCVLLNPLRALIRESCSTRA